MAIRLPGRPRCSVIPDTLQASNSLLQKSSISSKTYRFLIAGQSRSKMFFSVFPRLHSSLTIVLYLNDFKIDLSSFYLNIVWDRKKGRELRFWPKDGEANELWNSLNEAPFCFYFTCFGFLVVWTFIYRLSYPNLIPPYQNRFHFSIILSTRERHEDFVYSLFAETEFLLEYKKSKSPCQGKRAELCCWVNASHLPRRHHKVRL